MTDFVDTNPDLKRKIGAIATNHADNEQLMADLGPYLGTTKKTSGAQFWENVAPFVPAAAIAGGMVGYKKFFKRDASAVEKYEKSQASYEKDKTNLKKKTTELTKHNKTTPGKAPVNKSTGRPYGRNSKIYKDWNAKNNAFEAKKVKLTNQVKNLTTSTKTAPKVTRYPFQTRTGSKVGLGKMSILAGTEPVTFALMDAFGFDNETSQRVADMAATSVGAAFTTSNATHTINQINKVTLTAKQNKLPKSHKFKLRTAKFAKTGKGKAAIIANALLLAFTINEAANVGGGGIQAPWTAEQEEFLSNISTAQSSNETTSPEPVPTKIHR